MAIIRTGTICVLGHYRSNEVRLWLSVIAYNLGNLWALGAAQRSRQLVADQLAAAIGENRRSIGQARTIRLVAPGGKSSDAAALWRDAPADRSAAGSSGVAETTWLAEKSINKDVRGGAVFAKLQENEAISGFSRTRKQQG